MRYDPVAGIFSLALAATVLISGAPSFAASQLQVPSGRPIVRQALDYLRDSEEQTIGDQIALCEVPAPPFGEAARGEAYRKRFEGIGLADVRIDGEGNVLGEIGSGEPLVVLSAHLDTVFPAATDVTVRRDGSLLIGPGIGDDCRGLAVVLAVARAMRGLEIEPVGTIVFVGTVGEEGPGDLRGVKRLFSETLAGQVDYFISVDGAGHTPEVGCRPEGFVDVKHPIGSSRVRPDAKFSNMPCAITSLSQQDRITLLDKSVCERRRGERELMSAFYQASQQTCATGCANWSRHKRVFKPDTLVCQSIHGWSLKHRIDDAHHVESLIVGDDEQQIWSFYGIRRPLLRGTAHKKQSEK